jgi:hypothetical protein
MRSVERRKTDHAGACQQPRRPRTSRRQLLHPRPSLIPHATVAPTAGSERPQGHHGAPRRLRVPRALPCQASEAPRLPPRPSSRPLLPTARLACEPRSGAPAAPARHVAGVRAGRGLPVWQRPLPEGRPITTYRDRQAGTDRGGMDLACGHTTRPPRAGAPRPAALRPRAVSQAHGRTDL